MKLDYNIKTLDGRIQFAEEIIEENWDLIRRYFNNLILDEKNKRIPYNFLLNQLANYILYLDNQPKYKERTQHKFEKSAMTMDDKKDEYKFKRDIKLKKSDIENIHEIKDIQNFIIDLRRSQNPNLKGKKFRWIQDLKYNQVAIKNSKSVILKEFQKCTIPSFTDIYEINESCHDLEISDIHNPFNLNLFKQEDDIWADWKTLLKILPFKKQVSNNVDKLISIFNKCYDRCKDNLNPIQNRIIQIYRKGIENRDSFDFKVVKNKDLSSILGIDQNSIHYIVKSICKELCKAYEKLFTYEYYYLFLVKGKYKQCSKCNNIKLVQDFYHNRNICADCYNSSEENIQKNAQKS